MKALPVLACAIATLACTVAGAAPTSSDPLFGRWALDTSRLPMPPDARPKQVDITFAGAQGDRVSMAVDIVYAPGNEVHSIGIASLDGTPIPVKGSPEADIAAMSRPRPDVLVVVLGKNGGPASTRVYTVAADGKHLSESVTAYGGDGRPTLKTHYFTRLP